MTIASSITTPEQGTSDMGFPHITTQRTPAQTKIGHMLRVRVKSHSQSAADSLCPIARHQAIENALSMALWHVRHGTGIEGIQAATGRAIRATSMLKQACTDSAIGGRV